MALTGNVLAHQVHQSTSCSLLPFLYQTRTLCSIGRPKTRPKRHGPYRLFSTTRSTLVDLEETRVNNAIPFKRPSGFHRHKDKDAIPFEHPEEEKIAQERNALLPPPSPNSTITASEQAVFDRIFADIASSKRTTSENTFDEEDEVTAESFKDLNTIFNDAIDELQRRTDNEQKKTIPGRIIEYTPIVQDIPTLNSYSTELLDKAGWGKPGKIGSDDVSDLAEAHRQHRTKIERMLQGAETDLEVWQVLEKEVFSLVHELNARIEATEKGKRKRKGPRSRNNYSLSTNGEEGMISMTPASLQPTVLLSILQTEYPQYLLHACRLRRQAYPSSPYSLNFLPAVRRLGPVSYVLGASTALFNENLLLLWNQESNLRAMADLLDEMDKQGVESNEITIKFLKGVLRLRAIESQGSNGAWRRMWWGIADIEQGSLRLYAVLKRCIKEAKMREKEMEGSIEE